MSELVYGIAQLEVYSVAKKYCSDTFNIFELCGIIKNLEKQLDKYIQNDLEDTRLEIRAIGEYLAENGGYELMFAVCCLLRLKNNDFELITESIWSGIKDINGNVCWLA
ncbi:MAG: hypothetical protein QNJ63_15395 [Calothrix sp. MO_192.B10]|nr:hypothetical protein [Calothrix sp. MO_192.B10]